MTKALLVSLLLAATAVSAQSPAPSFYQMTRPQIAQALKKIHQANPVLSARVAAVSERFLGTPYQLGPLGEGASGRFDRLPLYRFDAVDCTTFVEEVMALALDPDLDHALNVTLRKIRYKNGAVGYESRNHFPETDWLPNNQAAGFLQDITAGVGGGRERLAVKTVSKRDWYLSKTSADLQGFNQATAAEKQSAVAAWHQEAGRYADVVSTVPYVPVADLAAVMSRIPSGSIANLVRADRPDKPIMISHQTLLVRKGGALYVRQASYGRFVEDIPFLDYFRRYAGSSWPLLGINIDEIRHP